MEKLIDLLGDYTKLLPRWKLVYNDEYKCFYSYVKGEELPNCMYHVGEVISKDFGFIKRLVEQDKIDKDNEDLISLMSELGEFNNYEKCLLMLLSIQDSPVEFLCEILR